MNEIKYGMISDVHEDPRIVSAAVAKLKALGANKLILNGDLGIHADSISDSQKHFSVILDAVAKSGLETYVQTGSHETTFAHEPVLSAFIDKYSNIIDVSKHSKIESSSHHLAFLAGSDWNSGGEYTFGHADIPTGTYFKTIDGRLIPLFDMASAMKFSSQGQLAGLMHYSNIYDLKNYVTHPDKTIVICHVPRKFDNPKTGIDSAHFVEQYYINTRMAMFKDDPNEQEKFFSYGGLFPANVPQASAILALDTTIKYSAGKNVTEEDIVSFAMKYSAEHSQDIVPVAVERKENRGNIALAKLYNDLGITKAVSGHFHESSHRAHDSNGIFVPQNTFVNNLFWNSGHLDAGLTGILTVKDNLVSYQNINLK